MSREDKFYEVVVPASIVLLVLWLLALFVEIVKVVLNG